MKRFKKLLALTAVLAIGATSAMANMPCKKPFVETYAHPTMFSSQAQQTVSADANYVVGGRILKSKNQFGLKNKDDVLIASWAKDVLNLIKTKQKSSESFNPKMPILRSEFAVVLSEGFNMTDTTVTKAYSDIQDGYWAKDWIYRALNGGIMIGYPEGVFKPDQPITKAEVFATIATIIDIPTDKSLIVPQFKDKDIAFIPTWAIAPTKEVIGSKLLEAVPNPDRVNEDEYLSKEQVAYLIGALRTNFASSKTIAKDENAPEGIKKYEPVTIKVKLTERVSARHSNVGDKFNATTTQDVTVAGLNFPAGSTVIGQVVEVARPGLGDSNKAYVKVKFLTLKNGNIMVDFPKQLSEAQADVLKNPNVIARLLGAPLTTAARITGVAGRTAAAGVNVCANGLEQYGDQLSNTLVNTATLHLGAGLKSFGNSFITVGKGVFNLCKLAVSGVFGVVYEIGDEIVYLFVPSLSNSSALNPNEELTIIF